VKPGKCMPLQFPSPVARSSNNIEMKACKGGRLARSDCGYAQLSGPRIRAWRSAAQFGRTASGSGHMPCDSRRGSNPDHGNINERQGWSVTLEASVACSGRAMNRSINTRTARRRPYISAVVIRLALGQPTKASATRSNKSTEQVHPCAQSPSA